MNIILLIFLLRLCSCSAAPTLEAAVINNQSLGSEVFGDVFTNSSTIADNSVVAKYNLRNPSMELNTSGGDETLLDNQSHNLTTRQAFNPKRQQQLVSTFSSCISALMTGFGMKGNMGLTPLPNIVVTEITVKKQDLTGGLEVHKSNPPVVLLLEVTLTNVTRVS